MATINELLKKKNKIQTVVRIRSSSLSDLNKYLRNGTLNNSIIKMNLNTWNEPQQYQNGPYTYTVYYPYYIHDFRLVTVGYYYHLQNNTSENNRISGNLNGYQLNNNKIDYDGSGTLFYWNNKQWISSIYNETAWSRSFAGLFSFRPYIDFEDK